MIHVSKTSCLWRHALQLWLPLIVAGRGGENLLAPRVSEQIGIFELPVTTEEWRKKFSQFVGAESRAWTYLEAASGRFLIRGGELGEYALRLERDVKPVRWVCRSNNHITTVRLIDDTGRDDRATCRFFSLRRPAEPTVLGTAGILAGLEVSSPGGLFEARHGELTDTIIVSMPKVEGGFQGLVIEPDLGDIDGDTLQVVGILGLLRLWMRGATARPARQRAAQTSCRADCKPPLFPSLRPEVE